MIKRSYIKISGLLFLFIGAVLIALAAFLPSLLDINAYRAEIITTIQQALNRNVSFASGSFSWKFGPSFVFSDVSVKERDGRRNFITADRIAFRLALIPLLERRIILREVILNKPEVSVERLADGTLSIDDLLTSRPESPQIQLTGVQIKQAVLHWRDAAVSKQGVTAEARNLSLSMDNLSRGKKTTFKLAMDLADGGGNLALSGSARIPAGVKPLAESDLNATLEARQIDYGRYWPYAGRFVPFDNPGGRIDLSSSYKGKLKDFAAKGKFRLAGATVRWPAVFHSTLAPKAIQIVYDLKLAGGRLDVPALELATDGFKIEGSLRIEDMGTSDPRIIAKATTPPFRYEDVRTYVPYGIIEKDASDYVENKIKGGLFRLVNGTLEGRVSQIAHMEKGQNYNTLFIYGTAEKGILSYGGKAPVFNSINGILELKGKNFSLKGMSGLFGTTPFKLDGSITEYNTDKRSEYPVRMELAPKPSEVAWLAGFVGATKLDFGGISTLVLNGSGPVNEYRLSGDWQLKQAQYSFPGAVNKPPGMASTLAFSSILSRTEAKITSLAYTLLPLNLSAQGLFRWGKPFLSFDLQTNQFLLNEALPILTKWRKQSPQGKVQAHIQGIGNPEDFSTMDYSGSIRLNTFSFHPEAGGALISNINGNLTFNGQNVESSNMNVLYGNSQVTVKGQLANFTNPQAELTLSSPELFLKDVNLRHPKINLSLKQLQAVIAIKEGAYTIRSLSGMVNSTSFGASGMYSGGRMPSANLAITSSNLNIDDLVLLSQANATGPDSGGVPLELKLKLSAEKGTYGKIPFKRLKGSIHREGGVLYLESLEGAAFGGRITAKGRVAPVTKSGAGNRYDLNLGMERLNADQFLNALDITHDVTGTLDLQGDITARGESLPDLKKTALGNLRLSIHDGKLRKFSVMSKVFSILNVSQLFSFHLPDMVSDGMPFSKISANIAVEDGVASSQDFFIKSEAMNISMIGNTDLVKQELNFTIGVQPLQTVDRVVNRIPVVGWLLTGKDKDFLTAYFEARGKWSDPQVTAIPAKSMAKGVLNIFRRVFELPVRLFTDTGEVILGQ